MDAELAVTKGPGEAARLAARGESFDVLVCAGGDGTLNEVLNGLRDQAGRPLGLLPAGTANVLAHELSIPFTPTALARLLVSGEHRILDVMRAGDRLSHLMVGVGFDAATLRILENGRRGPITKLSYLLPALRAFASCPLRPFEVSPDGGAEIRVHQLFATNVSMLGTKLMRFDHRAEPSDGRIDTYLARGGGRLSILRYLLRMSLRRLTRAHDVTFDRFQNLVVRSQEPVPYQVDGDYAGVLPVEIDLIPSFFHVAAPSPAPRNAAKGQS